MSVDSSNSAREWWQRAVIYQIYPLSFQDTDGDGRGDLAGIIARLDHLAWLGVDAVWLSPIFRSPMRDFGYDISDFTEIDPCFGTLETFDRLTAALHERGIRLILDFVPNHTAIEHPWFAESRASRTSAKRDWYVWADSGPDGAPPNNWLSRFGGSAWERDPATGQVYYHAFLKEQPDLNWRNPEVRRAMFDVLRFWLKRGVDGFRVDAAAVLAEDDLLRDDPPNPDFDEKKTPSPERFRRVFTDYRPESLEYLTELRAVVDEFPDRVLLGETQSATDRVRRFYGESGQARLHLPLNFLLFETNWEALALQAAIDQYLAAIPPGGWPNWVLGSHDKPRIATHLGPAQARVGAVLAFTLPGTPVFFAGDEIGMPNVPVADDQVRDPFEKLVPGFGLNRDPERAPMRWEPGLNAGFTSGDPWLPVGPCASVINVADERNASSSMLTLYRRLIGLRHAEQAFVSGAYQPQRARNGVLAFHRTLNGHAFLIAANLQSQAQVYPISARGRLRLSSYADRAGEAVAHELRLRADEAVIVALES
jgi:alpha-glucosidase